jgi:glycosyltransferase involved in cell wall biosynthesis
MRLQKEADLLYLPLAFETPWPDEIRTVFPTKAVEYLVSGTPILLHGPADCFTVKDAREQGWAHVIDTKDPEALREGIRRLVVDRSLREKLVENARAEAVRRDARRIAKGLQEDLGLL